MRKGLSLIVIVLITISLLAGCGPKTTTAGDQTTTQAAATNNATTTNATVAEKVELAVWDLRTEEENAKLADAIVAEFTKANPNIKVTRSAFQLEDLRNVIKPALNSGKGPDIFSYDAGIGYLGVLANAGLALDMTEYSKKFGWEERFQDWALKRGVFDGKLYGVANEIELLGIFYNKKIFADNGVEVPNTYQEFVDACKKFKEKGVLPIILDDLDQWPAFHYESIWLNAFVGPAKVKAALANKEKWNSPEFAKALDEFSALIKAGYTTEKPLSLTYEDANNLFYDGKGAMRPTGSWMVGEMAAKMKADVGLFFLPPASADVPISTPGGLGEAVVVNAKTKYPNESMAFVDFMFSKEMVKIWYEGGRIPAVKDVDYKDFVLSDLFKSILYEINNAKDLGENIDVLMTPKINDATMNYMQELIAGKKNGQQCLDVKQKAFDDEIAAGNYMP